MSVALQAAEKPLWLEMYRINYNCKWCAFDR